MNGLRAYGVVLEVVVMGSFVLNSAPFDVDSGASLILLPSLLSKGLIRSCCFLFYACVKCGDFDSFSGIL